jgi:glycosyltransferase involved in cell wall biosynthesis
MPMSLKRVLIITYYWPPTGASGVQRWLKFTKYLPENGWTPVVYTPENPERPAIDHSLEADIPAGTEIITHPIFEPYGLYKKLSGRNADESIQVGFVSDSGKPGLLETVSRWLRGNCLIPDARRFWIRPSVRRLTAILKEQPVDAIVSTGPPHSMHLIAQRLSKRFHIPWVADFRDPWSRFYYNNDLLFNSRTRRKQLKLEKVVLKNASRVITVSGHIRDELQHIGERSVDVIHNGYDPSDYENLQFEPSSSFVIAHTGAFQPAANPEKVWEVLGRLVKTGSSFAGDLKIVLVGKVDTAIKESISRNGLDAWVQYIGYVPHSEVMRYQITSALLLLCILRTEGAEGIITGKFFEYLASGTPVICVGPENGDTAAIIRECNAGDTAGFDDSSAMERIITGTYRKWKLGERHQTDKKAVLRYSRREQTRTLAGMLNVITGSPTAAQ